MGLSDPDWIQVFLLLGKKYLPLIFPSLSRHGNNLDALFTELISNVNQETVTPNYAVHYLELVEKLMNKSRLAFSE